MKILSTPEVASRIGVDPSNIGRMVKADRFPRGRKIHGRRGYFWSEAVVAAWENSGVPWCDDQRPGWMVASVADASAANKRALLALAVMWWETNGKAVTSPTTEELRIFAAWYEEWRAHSGGDWVSGYIRDRMQEAYLSGRRDGMRDGADA